MILIIGLGNPGKKFERTRHNIGFRVLDEFLNKNNFSDFKLAKKFFVEISEGIFDNKKIILAKPQAFMNNSGKAVKLLNSKFKILNSKLFVIHDDIDLPLGKIRISAGRSSAGHKGVESIIRELKTRDFVRFRIGINQFAQNQKSKTELPFIEVKVKKRVEPSSPLKNQKLDEFVLEKFNKEEEKILKEVIEKTLEAIEIAMEEGVEKAMAKYN